MQNRILNIQKKLDNNEALLITSPSNRFYLTDFHSSAGCVFITKDEAFFLVDFRYFEKAKSTVHNMATVLQHRFFEDINGIIERKCIETVFVETDYVSVEDFARYSQKMVAQISNNNKFSVYLKEMRSVKTEQEISRIRRAAELTDRAFSYILDKIRVGASEKDIALDLEFFMRKNGSEGVSFDFIVVSGKNSSLPHGVPTDKKIQKGDFVTLDFGAVVNGYRSDMTRTVAVGSVTEEQKAVYETVLKAQNAAIAYAKAGVICSEVDAVSRDIITKAGYGDNFGHGLGHSVGIEIHESPCFNTSDQTVLKENMVITVEPGIYLENKYGIRIEDMIIIEKDGCKDITSSPKQLMVIE